MTITATILTPANGVAESRNFYERLSFQAISESEPIWLSDGSVIIELAPTTASRAGLKLYGDDWSDVAERLRKVAKVSEKDGLITASDPNGVRAYLQSGAPPEAEMPAGTTGLTGNFAGLTIEAVDPAATCRFWECLGYKIEGGSAEHGFVKLGNDSGIGVSILGTGMCPHLFFNPGLSFFNGSGNLEVIRKIRDAGVPITEEITVFNDQGVVDNIIIRDPGGLCFFIFSD